MPHGACNPAESARVDGGPRRQCSGREHRVRNLLVLVLDITGFAVPTFPIWLTAEQQPLTPQHGHLLLLARPDHHHNERDYGYRQNEGHYYIAKGFKSIMRLRDHDHINAVGNVVT
jgi:hypothetical protein